MTSTDWATAASLATALGTLVLAIATFSAVRPGNREDPPLKVNFGGQRVITRFRMQQFISERAPRTPSGERRPWMASVTRHWNLDRPDPR